jgi:RNA polymerase sigma factor (sigma-70 family)
VDAAIAAARPAWSPSENRILERALALSPEDVVARLFEERADRLWRYARRQGAADRQTAEDAVQDSFAALLRILQSDKGKGVRSPRAYLYRVVRNRVAELRCEPRTEPLDQADREQDLTAHSDWMLGYQRASERLTPRQREVMDLLVQNLSVEEIAEILDLTKNCVEVHISNARKRLQPLLLGCGPKEERECPG